MGVAEGSVAPKPSIATERETEESGRSPELEVKKKTKKVLERWPHLQGGQAIGPTKTRLKGEEMSPPQEEKTGNKAKKGGGHSTPARKKQGKNLGGMQNTRTWPWK